MADIVSSNKSFQKAIFPFKNTDCCLFDFVQWSCWTSVQKHINMFYRVIQYLLQHKVYKHFTYE